MEVMTPSTHGRPSGSAGWLVLTALTSACIATAPTVDAGHAGFKAGTGVVVGSFGAPPASGSTPASRRLRVLHLGTDEEWFLPFREGDSRDGGQSAPFIAELPAGKYKIIEWSLDSLDQELRGGDTLVVFDVVPTQVTCIGALYPIRQGDRPASQSTSGNILLTLRILPRDECPALEPLFASVAPNLRATMRTRLAVNVTCPSCRAEIGAATTDAPPPVSTPEPRPFRGPGN